MFNANKKYIFTVEKYMDWRRKTGDTLPIGNWVTKLSNKEVQYKDSLEGLIGRYRISYEWCEEVI